jgi:uncharacterized protein GlcG (DUF336 family)
MKKSIYSVYGLALGLVLVSTTASAINCAGLPNNKQLRAALSSAQAEKNGGFGLHMWATVVNREGFVCTVAFSGADRNQQWPGSRIISAQKAYTANAFSLDGLALSTANLYSATQPGGSLFGLQASNPIDASVAYKGNPIRYGLKNDPLSGLKIGGINVFGGGLGLYKKVNGKNVIVGAIGVSGDSSCADHNIAWRTRANLAGLGLNVIPSGVSLAKDDGMVYDHDKVYAGWDHPDCGNGEMPIAKTIGAGQ